MRRNSWWGADEHGEFVVSDGNQTLCEGSGSEFSEFIDNNYDGHIDLIIDIRGGEWIGNGPYIRFESAFRSRDGFSLRARERGKCKHKHISSGVVRSALDSVLENSLL